MSGSCSSGSRSFSGSCSRRGIAPLLQELEYACRRPLFTEICLDEKARKEAYQRKHRARERIIKAETGADHDDHHDDMIKSDDNTKNDGGKEGEKRSDGKGGTATPTAAASAAGKQSSSLEGGDRKRSWREVRPRDKLCR